MKTILKVEKISKYYKYDECKYNVLNNVSLKISYGQTMAIIGTSGTGKSTLLHILGALDKPNSGKIFYKNKNIFNFDDSSLAKFRNKVLGFVFQFHYLMNDFSALENVMIPALIGRVSSKTAIKKAKNLLHKVGMENKTNFFPDQLSGGERQRIAIARALIQNPKILLADEPTGNLDKDNEKKIKNLLLEINKETGTALVIVTHNKSLASCMSKQLKLSDGKLLKFS